MAKLNRRQALLLVALAPPTVMLEAQTRREQSRGTSQTTPSTDLRIGQSQFLPTALEFHLTTYSKWIVVGPEGKRIEFTPEDIWQVLQGEK